MTHRQACPLLISEPFCSADLRDQLFGALTEPGKAGSKSPIMGTGFGALEWGGICPGHLMQLSDATGLSDSLGAGWV